MHTNRFGVYIDIFSIDGANLAFPKHSQDARRRFQRIMQQSVRSRARNERTVGEVISVRKHFARDLQTV